MNRDEKNLQTRQKIIDSALQEFGGKSYGETSLNTVCTSGNISKGIVYHYFKDKEELYLICIQECLDALTAYLRQEVCVGTVDIKTGLQQYFDARAAFFDANPHYLNLFYSAVVTPPRQLIAAIGEIRAELDALNRNILTGLLANVRLCPQVTVPEVVEMFREYQDFIQMRYQVQATSKITREEHDARSRRTLSVLLYGVIDREEAKNE